MRGCRVVVLVYRRGLPARSVGGVEGGSLAQAREDRDAQSWSKCMACEVKPQDIARV